MFSGALESSPFPFGFCLDTLCVPTISTQSLLGTVALHSTAFYQHSISASSNLKVILGDIAVLFVLFCFQNAFHYIVNFKKRTQDPLSQIICLFLERPFLPPQVYLFLYFCNYGNQTVCHVHARPTFYY